MANRYQNLLSVWIIIAKNKIQNQLLTPSSSFLFIVGKLFNYSFSILTILAIFGQNRNIQGYTLPQALIFVVFFNFIESLIQFFFRSLYTFRNILIKGDFDLDLLKPLPSFFRPMLSGPDFLDLPLIIIQLITLIYLLAFYQFPINASTLLIFAITLFSSITIAFSIHLSIAAFSVLTTEVDSLVAFYRNLGRAAAVPTDIYKGLLRFILDYIVPITIISTVPAKALTSLLTTQTLLFSLLYSLLFFFISVSFWRYSLRHYSSASS